MLDGISCPDFKEPIEYQTLKIKLHPQKYFTVNRANRIQFEEQKLSDVLNMSADIDPEVKAARLSESMNKLVDLGIQAVVESVDYIETEDGDRIIDKAYLTEFFQNAESTVIRSIQDRLADISDQAKIKPINLVCNDCSKEYNIDLIFDYASFFGKGF